MEFPKHSPIRPKESVFRTSEPQGSPTSAMDLYPIVRDLSEIEYNGPGDILSYLVDGFMRENEEGVEVLSADCHPEDYRLLMTPDLSVVSPLSASPVCSLEDSFRDLPDIPPPMSHRRRCTSFEDAAKCQQPPLLPSKAKLHRRAFSEGAYVRMAALADETEKQQRFLDRYVLTRKFFQCTRSAIWECIHRESGQRYCVKIMNKTKNAQKEIKRLRHAQSQFTVQLVQVIEEEKSLYMVMELLSGSNLLSKVIQEGTLSESFVQQVAFNLLTAVDHLHQDLGMCHNNLQPSNIVVVDNMDVPSIRLVDYGSAVSTNDLEALNTDCPLPYRPPERQASTASDMFSVGVVLYFCLVGQQPCLEHGHEELFDRLYKKKPSTRSPMSRQAKQLICSLIHIDPEVRLTAAEALQHPWLAGLASLPLVEKARCTVPKPESLIRASSSDGGRKRRPGERIARSLSRLASRMKNPERLSSSSSFHSHEPTDKTDTSGSVSS